jgi:hypothetical protein
MSNYDLQRSPVEFQLMVSLLRLPTQPEIESNVQHLMSQKPDWSQFVKLAIRHKVVPQLYGTLDAASKSIWPSETRDTLKRVYLRNSKRAMIRCAATVEILKRFEEVGIQGLALKGPPLALWAYGDVSHRFAGDLDLFVDARQAQLAELTVEESGYKNITAGLRFRDRLKHHTAHAEFKSDRLDLTLELHWRLTHHRLLPFDFATLISRSQNTDITGFPIPVMSPEDRFVYLIVHGSNHGWFRLAWLCDIVQIMERHPELSWSDIGSRTSAMGLSRVFGQSLNLVSDVLGARIPEGLRSSEIPDGAEATLTQTALGAMQSPNAFLVNWDKLTWREIVSGTRYRLKLHRSLSYKVGVLRKMLIRPQDWDDFPLPGFLFPLYYILNPALMLIRIFTKPRT